MDKNPTMTATPYAIVTKLNEKEAAIQRDNRLAPQALLFAKKRGKGGKGPKRDKRDDKDVRKEKDDRKCFHYQRRGDITENWVSKQSGNLPKAVDTAANASTEASSTSTLTTSIAIYWMAASSTAVSSDWFIDCACRTDISGHHWMFFTFTESPPNTKKVRGYNCVILFASRYRSVGLICQLPDWKTLTIILQEVVHLPGSFNRITQPQNMHRDLKVEHMNHYSLNLYNRHGK